MPSIFSGPQKSLHCDYCRRQTLHESDIHIWGACLTVATCGLFLFILPLPWLLGRHYACQVCGSKRRPFG